jgi:hypothetical protein
MCIEIQGTRRWGNVIKIISLIRIPTFSFRIHVTDDNGDERRFRVDGYVAEGRKIYEVYGCYYHVGYFC